MGSRSVIGPSEETDWNRLRVVRSEYHGTEGVEVIEYWEWGEVWVLASHPQKKGSLTKPWLWKSSLNGKGVVLEDKIIKGSNIGDVTKKQT